MKFGTGPNGEVGLILNLWRWILGKLITSSSLLLTQIKKLSENQNKITVFENLNIIISELQLFFLLFRKPSPQTPTVLEPPKNNTSGGRIKNVRYALQ